MVDAWPAGLPQCFIVGYSEGAGDGGVLEYQPDQGPSISRRRTAAATHPLSGQMRMTRDQIATLRAFLYTTILGGSLPFTFPDPTATGETLLVKFAKGSLPNWQQIGGGIYRVTISMTVLP
jgi:hypothetical protein